MHAGGELRAEGNLMSNERPLGVKRRHSGAGFHHQFVRGVNGSQQSAGQLSGGGRTLSTSSSEKLIIRSFGCRAQFVRGGANAASWTSSRGTKILLPEMWRALFHNPHAGLEERSQCHQVCRVPSSDG